MQLLHKKKTVTFFTVTISLAAFCTAALWQGLAITSYTFPTEKLTAPLRVAVLTDLHSTQYGPEQSQLVTALEQQSPDIVVLVGDIIDDKAPLSGATALFQAIGSKFPCYYVTGNHEWRREDVSTLWPILEEYGIHILSGTCEQITVQGQTICLCGVDDPSSFVNSNLQYNSAYKSWTEQLNACHLQAEEDQLTILLSHRPEYIQTYANYGFHLILSGHAHGGQVRLPGLVNGLFAPGQGFFPQYAGGSYTIENSTLIVSRGLCRNSLPRVFNRPEIVIVNLTPP